MAVWPTHRKKKSDAADRRHWARRQARLQRRARAVKPNDRQRVKPKTQAAEDLDPTIWARL